MTRVRKYKWISESETLINQRPEYQTGEEFIVSCPECNKKFHHNWTNLRHYIKIHRPKLLKKYKV